MERRKILLAVCVSLTLVACSTPKELQQPKAAVEPPQQPKAATEPAQLIDDYKQQQEERERQAEERKRRDEEAARLAAEAEQAQIKRLSQSSIPEEPLSDPISMLKDSNNPLFNRSVYYEYDSYSINQQYLQVIEAHAKFLVEHKGLKVRVEGNCDENGSREYNLALGQRRADSVKRAFTLFGVPADQISTVSFGAEKPRATGHGDQVWAENRRSDIMYAGIDSQN